MKGLALCVKITFSVAAVTELHALKDQIKKVAMKQVQDALCLIMDAALMVQKQRKGQDIKDVQECYPMCRQFVQTVCMVAALMDRRLQRDQINRAATDPSRFVAILTNRT